MRTCANSVESQECGRTHVVGSRIVATPKDGAPENVGVLKSDSYTTY